MFGGVRTPAFLIVAACVGVLVGCGDGANGPQAGPVQIADEGGDRLLCLNDRRITANGVIVLKAQTHRSQDMNRSEALQRLQEMVDSVATVPPARKPTKPTRASQRRRVEGKRQRSEVKALRGSVRD